MKVKLIFEATDSHLQWEHTTKFADNTTDQEIISWAKTITEAEFRYLPWFVGLDVICEGRLIGTIRLPERQSWFVDRRRHK